MMLYGCVPVTPHVQMLQGFMQDKIIASHVTRFGGHMDVNFEMLT